MGLYFTKKWVPIGSLSQSLGVPNSFGDSASVTDRCCLSMSGVSVGACCHLLTYLVTWRCLRGGRGVFERYLSGIHEH